MADTRYLKKRGNRWWFQLAVPTDLQDQVGRKVIAKPLGTTDVIVAGRKRWKHLAEAQESFDRLRSGASLSSAEMEEEAHREFRRNLEEAARLQAGGQPFASMPFEEPPVGQFRARLWWETEETEGIQFIIHELGEAIEDTDFRFVLQDVRRLAEARGATLAEGSAAETEFCRAILRARLEAAKAILALRRGEPYEPARPFNPSAIDPVTLDIKEPAKQPITSRRDGKGVTVSEAAAKFVAEKMRDTTAAWTNQTRTQNEATYRLFTDFTEDAPIAQVTRQDAAGFIDTLAKLHRHWGRSGKTKERSLTYLLENHAGPPCLSNRTLNRHVTALVSLFKWAKTIGAVDGDPPFAGMLKKTPSARAGKYPAFSIDELNKLFGAPLYTDVGRQQRTRPNNHDMKMALRWAPLIALYSGMRSEELCGLLVSEVIDDNGIVYFDVNDFREGRRVKTDASVRKIPVHPMLVEVGFLEYLSAVAGHPTGRLFPGLKPGGPDNKLNWYFSKAFTTFRRSVGIDRERVGFHSFRSNVATALEGAGFNEGVAAKLLGHEFKSMSYGLYSEGLGLPARRDVIEQIKYEGLELAHLTA